MKNACNIHAHALLMLRNLDLHEMMASDVQQMLVPVPHPCVPLPRLPLGVRSRKGWGALQQPPAPPPLAYRRPNVPTTDIRTMPQPHSPTSAPVHTPLPPTQGSFGQLSTAWGEGGVPHQPPTTPRPLAALQ